MRIKLLVGIVGADFALSPGDHFTCPDDEAIRMIEAGFGVPDPVAPERAVKAPVETRAKKKK